MRNKMKKRNGFTLVELLAVIVVLAIIMVIAIPSVLEAMNNAKKNSFVLYMEKVFKSTSEYYLQDSATEMAGAGYYIYDITTDIGQNSSGNFKGYVLVDASDVDDVQYIVYLNDKSYMALGHNASKDGFDKYKPNSYKAGDAANMKDPKSVCSHYLTSVKKTTDKECIKKEADPKKDNTVINIG